MRLSDFRDDGKGNVTLKQEGTFPITVLPTNIDDIVWYGKARGMKTLEVLPNQLQPIWQFLAANTGRDDKEMIRHFFIEGECSRILGVNIKVLPYNYVERT